MMKKHKKVIIIIIIILALSVSSYFIYKHFSSKDDNKNKDDNTNTNNNVKPIINTSVIFPLVRGSRGDHVAKLQNALNVKFHENLPKTGFLGTLTEKALNRAGYFLPLNASNYKKVLNGESGYFDPLEN